MLRNRPRGFTLIELLVVVAIIGIIAAILIPNLLDALQKSKQKRTISDIRNLGSSWLSWLTDQVSAASAGQSAQYDATNHQGMDYTSLYEHLHPTDSMFYMQSVPQFDGWGFDFEFARNTNTIQANVLLICSSTRDGTLASGCEGTAHDVGVFATTDYDQDIIWADGYFVQAPGIVGSGS